MGQSPPSTRRSRRRGREGGVCRGSPAAGAVMSADRSAITRVIAAPRWPAAGRLSRVYGRISASVAGRSTTRSTVVKVLAPAADSLPDGRCGRPSKWYPGRRPVGLCERLGRVRRVVRTRSRDNIAGGVSDGGRLSRLYGDVEIAGSGADGRAHQRNRRRAGLTITAVIAGPQRAVPKLAPFRKSFRMSFSNRLMKRENAIESAH
jgi:hypothetical protein